MTEPDGPTPDENPRRRHRTFRDTAHRVSGRIADGAGAVRARIKRSAKPRPEKKPAPFEEAVDAYNRAHAQMSSSGISLLRQRERSTDLIELTEHLVNSIANTPKFFATDFAEIDQHTKQFFDVQETARRDLENARRSITGAGAGVTGGVAVASIAPTAAMWVATTFGTASTGTAISTLSGAAATKAALAWLGGGALASGGGGMAGGTTVLALAGPIGWTVAGTALLASIALYSRGKVQNRKKENQALARVKEYTARSRQLDVRITALIEETASLREQLLSAYQQAIPLHSADFVTLSSRQQDQLGALVNNAKSAAALLGKHLDPDEV